MIRRIALVCLCLAATSALLADWPEFLNGSAGVVAKSDVPLARTWPEDGPKQLWKVKVNDGFGAPSVFDGKVFLLDRDMRGGKDVLVVYGLKDGSELWRYEYDAGGRYDFPGGRSTPAVDEDHVYTIGPLGAVHCISRKSRASVWSRDLGRDFLSQPPNRKWAMGHSPLLYKEWVIIPALGRKAGLVAMDRKTGKEAWRSQPVGDLTYSTPTLATVDGVDQFVTVTMQGVCGIAAKDGEVLWRFDGWKDRIPIPSPTPCGEGRFFVVAGYGGGCAMFQVERKGSAWRANKLWSHKKCNGQIPTAVYQDGYVYSSGNSNRPKDGLMCLDAETGKVIWQTNRDPWFERGNFVMVEGMIYIVDGREGTFHLVEPSPEGYKEIARTHVAGGGQFWSPPTIANGLCLLRARREMVCLDLSAKGNGLARSTGGR